MGESITVKYTVDTSYFPDGCCCGTCKPEFPPVAVRRTGETDTRTEKKNDDSIHEGSGKKRARRGGRRSIMKMKKGSKGADDIIL